MHMAPPAMPAPLILGKLAESATMIVAMEFVQENGAATAFVFSRKQLN